MSDALKREKHFLNHLVHSTTVKGKKSLFKTLTRQQINVLTEIFLNILQKTVDLSEEEKKKLLKHKKFIRKIANKRKTLKKRKDLLIAHPVIANRVLKTVWPKIMDYIKTERKEDGSEQADNTQK